MFQRLQWILTIALALFGAFLLALDIGGLFLSLRDPGLAADPGLLFDSDVSLTPSQAYTEIAATAADKPTRRALRLNRIVNRAIAHHWPTGSDKYHLRVPPWENYLLWFRAVVDPEKYAAYEFADPRKALERGFGLCSQHALALAGLLQESGIEPTIAVLGGHVVVEAQLDGRPAVLDPDFGLAIPHGIEELGRNPALAVPFYAKAASHCRRPTECDPAHMAGLYGPEGNHLIGQGAIGYLGPDRVAYERRSYLLIWVIPLLLLIPLALRLGRFFTAGMDRDRRRRLATIAAVMIIPLLPAAWTRSASLAAAWNQPLEQDAAAFLQVASGPGSFYSAAYREPFFIALHRMTLKAAGGDWRVIRLQSFVFSLALGLALAFVGLRALRSSAAAAVAPLIFGLTPFAVFLAARGLREELFLFLALLFFDRMFAAAERPRSSLLPASLLAAALVMTRETGFVLVGATAGLAFFKQWKRAGIGRDPRRLARLGLACATPVLVAIVLSAPFFINQAKTFGSPMQISRRNVTFWRNQEFRDRPGWPTTAEVEADPYHGPLVGSFEYLFRLHSPAQGLLGMAKGFWRAVTFYFPHMLGGAWWLMLLAIPGVYRLWKLGRWEWILAGPLLLLPFSFILSLSAAGHQSVDARFAIAGYPGLLILIGAGVDLALSYRRERRAQSESATT